MIVFSTHLFLVTRSSHDADSNHHNERHTAKNDGEYQVVDFSNDVGSFIDVSTAACRRWVAELDHHTNETGAQSGQQAPPGSLQHHNIDHMYRFVALCLLMMHFLRTHWRLHLPITPVASTFLSQTHKHFPEIVSNLSLTCTTCWHDLLHWIEWCQLSLWKRLLVRCSRSQR